MKIRVERHDNPVIGPGVVENVAIGGSAEPEGRRVDGVDTVSGQMSGGAPGRSLIQQQAHQAAPSRISSSSR